MELIFFIVIPFLLLVAGAWFQFRPKFSNSPIPLVALLVVLAGAVLGHEVFNQPVGPIPITIDRLILIVGYGLFAWLFLKGREDVSRLNSLDYWIVVYLAVVGCSTITHDWSILKNMPLARFLFFVVMPAALYWLVRNSRVKIVDLKFIATTLAFFGVYLALTAVAEIKGLTGLVFPKYIMTSSTLEFLGRGRGPFLNPVSNGIFISTCFCFAVAWWPRVNDSKAKMLIGTGALILAIGVYATLTRSCWLGFVIVGLIFVFMPAKRQEKGMMVIFGTVCMIVLFPILSEKIFSFKRDKAVTQNEMEKSAQMRPMFLLVATKMFKDRPILGVGYGQYSVSKDPYLKDPVTNKPLTITKGLTQHNVFLAYLTETGLVGLSALTLMLLMMGRYSWVVWRDQSLDLWARQFGLVGLAVLAAHSVNGMFHDVSIISMQQTYLFFLLGLVSNIHSNRSMFQKPADTHFENNTLGQGEVEVETEITQSKPIVIPPISTPGVPGSGASV